MATWNGPGAGTFEGEPLGTTDAGTTDETFKALKQEVRERGAVEHDWSDATVSTNPKGTNDDGRHREGSARVFHQDAAPTQLAVVDQLGSQALDDGRVWVDSNDGNRVYVYDAGAAAWEEISLGTLASILDVTAATASGERLQFLLDTEFGKAGGDGWVPVQTIISQDYEAASTAYTTAASPRTWTPNTANPSLTVPATGKFYIEVQAYISVQGTASSVAANSFQLALHEKVGAGAMGAISAPEGPVNGDMGANEPSLNMRAHSQIHLSYVRSSVTNGETYEYALIGTATTVNHQTTQVTRLIAKLIPY